MFVRSLGLLECLKALGYMERAAESYGKVVELAPLHLDARISLSTLQQQLGRPERALEALEPMYDPDTLVQDANAAQQVGRAQKEAFPGACGSQLSPRAGGLCG